MDKIKVNYLVLAAIFFISFPLFAEVKREKNIGSDSLRITSRGTQPERDFLSIETNSFTIYYEQDVNLKRVYRKLQGRRFYVDGDSRSSTLSGFDEKIAYRINLILERVKQILGMYPAGVKFDIKIFKDPETIYDKWLEISKKKEKVKAFYVHEYRTVYISEDTISDSVMAHEMAHVITNFYFIIRPPYHINDMMAIYVDSHLED